MPNSSVALQEKNEKIKDEYNRTLRKICRDETRSTEELDKQLSSVRREVLDMMVFQTIYKKHSLPDPQDSTVFRGSSDVNSVVVSLPPLDPNRTHRQLAEQRKHDPFMLKRCLADTGVAEKTKNQETRKKLRGKVGGRVFRSVRRGVPRSNVDSNRSVVGTDYRSDVSHKSIMPGNCTSFFSLRQFYDKEKDKLVKYWSSTERRKRAINRIKHDAAVTQFSGVRRQMSNIVHLDRPYALPSHTTLPPIENSG